LIGTVILATGSRDQEDGPALRELGNSATVQGVTISLYSVDSPPGDVSNARDAITLSRDIEPGEYSFSIAIVAAESAEGEAVEPVVRLGIKGRADDGWYPISRLVVE